MTDDPYTQRELDSHFKEIKETLCRIETQVLKTNGRVNVLEDKVIGITTSGKVANWAFGLTVPLILTMVTWVFFNQLEVIREEQKHQIEVLNQKIETLSDKLK